MKTKYDALEALATKAAPGPWKGDRIDGTVKYELLDANGACVVRGDNANSGGWGPSYGIMRQEDEDFLLAANPAAVLDLIADVQAQAGTLSSIETALDEADRNGALPFCLEGLADSARAALARIQGEA